MLCFRVREIEVHLDRGRAPNADVVVLVIFA